jgi:predicted alpha-1,6-mannanase (GH76 family)
MRHLVLGAVALFILQACGSGGAARPVDGGSAGAGGAPAGAMGGGGAGVSGGGGTASAGAAGGASTGGAGAGGAGPSAGTSGADAGGGADGDARGDARGSDGAPDAGVEAAPEPVFNATALTVTGTAGTSLCRLSDDGRYLLLALKNGGTTETGPTQVRVSTDGAMYELRVPTPTLAAGQSADVRIDRAPLVGFVEDWRFTVTLDPDGKHGGPHAPVRGECFDLRSRAAAGMGPLASWYDQATGLWNHNDWWTSANQLETVIDHARETGDPTYFAEIDNTFVRNQAGKFDQFGFYDDDGWWAITWIKAYDLSHQQKYLDMAKTIFARMTGGWSTACGGGIYWASAKAGADGLKNKNAIPNSLFLQVAAKLHLRTPGDAGAGSYLDWAQREWAWFKGTGMLGANKLVVDGLDGLTTCKAAGPVFTYNNGVLMGALVDLAASTGDATLLDEASAIAHATMKLMVDANGTLRETPCGGDICTQFKGVFMRNLALLYRARPLPELQTFMRHQSDQLWNSNRNAQNQFGYEWQLPFDKATASRQSSALDALVAAVASANLNLALGATATGGATCSPAEPPSNAIDGSSRGGSKWCAAGAGDQTLSVDLGSPRLVVGFRLRHAGAGGESPGWNTRDFELETSADGQTWTRAVTVTGNTADVTTHPIPAVTARHARLHVTTAQTATDLVAARIYELEVFGIGL